MKKRSVKGLITLWLTLLMAVLASLLLVFLLSISSRVLSNSARQELTEALRADAAHVRHGEDGIAVSQQFSFYYKGVNVLIYSRNETLLAGQPPISFEGLEGFENGEFRSAGDYLVLDMWLPEGWDDGMWLRGIIEQPDSARAAGTMLSVALPVLPVFLLISALGAYLILRRSFKPLQRINDTAQAINDGTDLSRRIALPDRGDEFSTQAASFDRLFGRLERSFEAEKRFTADASHELRTPVAVIKGACEYAGKYGESIEELQESLSMIERQADRMSALINQLLSMTRLEQGTEQLNLQRLELGQLARSLCLEYEPKPELELQEGVHAAADERLMERLIINLLDNAFKYGESPVRLRVFAEGAFACISVSDRGPGIAEAEREKIWQRFYQADTSRSEGGAGLGLSLVQQIAKLHGGTVTLESAPGQGSCFTIKLPLVDIT